MVRKEIQADSIHILLTVAKIDIVGTHGKVAPRCFRPKVKEKPETTTFHLPIVNTLGELAATDDAVGQNKILTKRETPDAGGIYRSVTGFENKI